MAAGTGGQTGALWGTGTQLQDHTKGHVHCTDWDIVGDMYNCTLYRLGQVQKGTESACTKENM